MTSAQVGKTEILNNVVGYYIDQDPCPILIVQPTIEMGETWSKDRLAPMLRDTPILRGLVKDPRSKDSGNTLRMKEFPGGRIAIAGANSAASLASRPVRIVLQDEIDRFPPSAGSEGSPTRLADKRAQTFWNRKRGKFSTPTVKGVSAIEAEWERSDQRRYHVPCPFCGGFQILIWGQVKWTKDEKDRPGDVHYECEHCRAKIYEPDKLRMIRNGRWVAGRPEVRGHAGFHLNELYSPWSAWQKVVEDFLEAKKRPETLKVWVNTSLGETWEEEGLTVDDGSLLSRREEYTAPVPLGVAVLTAGVDVQDDRLLVKVKGWGRGEESWLIDWITIPGRPETDPKVWADLDAVLSRVWAHELGTTLRIAAACIDSGGHATKQAYDFARTRGHRRIFAIKGVGGAGAPVIKLSTRKNKGKVVLALVGADTCKGLIYSRLQVEEYGPGYMHFPRKPEIDEEYFKQLTAEKQITKFVRGFPSKVWMKTRARNEALDCFDSEMEVLTRDGWRYFRELRPGVRLATVNLATDLIEYQRPTEIIDRPHDGPMLRVAGRRLNFMVTPKHRMVTYRKAFDRKAKKWNFDVPPTIVLAKDLTVHHTLKIKAGWGGISSDKVKIPASVSPQGREIEPEREISAKDMAAFLGWFVSEGHTNRMVSETQGSNRHRVIISQNPGEKQDGIRELLDRLPWKWNLSAGRQFVCTSKQLYEYVIACGEGVANKCAPDWIKQSDIGTIQAFVDAAVLGDGWIQDGGVTYATISRTLADDMQELFIKLGGSPSLTRREPSPYRIRGREGSNTQPQYWVRQNGKCKSAALDGKDHKFMVESVPYQGRVYCATVPNGTLIVRREGKMLIAGNCEAYALAALATLNANLDQLAHRLEAQSELSKKEPERPEPPPSIRIPGRSQLPPRKGWSATKW
jgi:phage terminase large subunit GpA-like protein